MTYMDDARQAPHGEHPAGTNPIELIEAALVTMRRDQSRRRLQRRAESATDDANGPHREELHGHGHGHGRGREPRGGHRGEPGGDGPGHPQHHGGRRGDGLAQAGRFRLLDALEGAERAPSVSELAEMIGVDQPRASRLVQAAVDAGHARREADPADARRSAIVLTASGRALLAAARENRRTAVETALAGFTPEETAEFSRLLTRFIAAWPRD
jgi:DNA-binding MarR family transcriptional regulator